MIADGATIGRVTVQAPSAKGDVAWRLRVANQLSGLELAPRGMPPQSVLIVRRLDDAQPGLLFRSREEWASQVRGELGTAWQRAARPARGDVAQGATTVGFSDRAEWLACLTRDLLDGTAHDRWWWRSVLARGEPTLGEVWRSEARVLPQALRVLESMRPGMRERAVHQLSRADAAAVLAAVVSEYDMPSARVVAAVEAHEAASDGAAATAAPEHRRLLAVLRALAGDAVVVAPVLASRAEVTTGRVRSLSGPEAVPTERQAPRRPVEELPADLVDETRAGESAGRARSGLNLIAARAPDAQEALRHRWLEPDVTGHHENAISRPAGSTESELASATHVDEARRAEAVLSPGRGAVDGEAMTQAEPEVIPSFAGAEDDDPDAPHETEAPIATGLGGLWYLVNALEDAGGLAEQPDAASAWRLLASVARELIDGVVADACWGVLAELANEDTTGVQSTAADKIETAIEAVRLRFGAAGVEREAIGEALTVPAQLYVTRTHVDVMFALESIDVRMRQAGLDRDPGWVPALGRVILFHFGRDGQ